MKQSSLFKSSKSAYGGDLLKKRKGRVSGRPLAVRTSMHLVLRSTKARGKWSMKHARNEQRIKSIAEKFCARYHVRLISLANVGNHLHFHIQLSRRSLYAPFIRSLTGSIALAVTGRTRWKVAAARLTLNEKTGEVKSAAKSPGILPVKPLRFWDCRPFTRVIVSRQSWLNLRDYVQVNVLEGFGYSRTDARWIVQSANSRRLFSG